MLYHQLSMIGSCILKHRSNYSFDIVMSMGMPTSAIYMSHIICISRIDKNHINTKTKSHHTPAPEAPPLCKKCYDVRRPYDEILPSHIRRQYVNPKKSLTQLYMAYTTQGHPCMTLISPHWTPTPSNRLKNEQKGLQTPKRIPK